MGSEEYASVQKSPRISELHMSPFEQNLVNFRALFTQYGTDKGFAIVEAGLSSWKDIINGEVTAFTFKNKEEIDEAAVLAKLNALYKAFNPKSRVPTARLIVFVSVKRFFKDCDRANRKLAEYDAEEAIENKKMHRKPSRFGTQGMGNWCVDIASECFEGLEWEVLNSLPRGMSADYVPPGLNPKRNDAHNDRVSEIYEKIDGDIGIESQIEKILNDGVPGGVPLNTQELATFTAVTAYALVVKALKGQFKIARQLAEFLALQRDVMVVGRMVMHNGVFYAFCA
jgi:hypothetical protein